MVNGCILDAVEDTFCVEDVIPSCECLVVMVKSAFENTNENRFKRLETILKLRVGIAKLFEIWFLTDDDKIKW